MSNIPKFRAYNTTTRRMFDVVKIDFMLNQVEYVDKNDNSRCWCYITSVEDKFMQSTGLKDKNYTEIYEKDIVKLLDKYLYTVEWSKKDAAYKLSSVDKQFSDCYFSNYENITEIIEVIGNVYKNPELLKK